LVGEPGRSSDEVSRARDDGPLGVELYSEHIADPLESVGVATGGDQRWYVSGAYNIERRLGLAGQSSAVRTLYYTQDGFEISTPRLGAQRQLLGGGGYDRGIGFAIGLDRLVLAAIKANTVPEPCQRT